MHNGTEEIRGQLVFENGKSLHTTLPCGAAWMSAIFVSHLFATKGFRALRPEKKLANQKDQFNTRLENYDSGIT